MGWFRVDSVTLRNWQGFTVYKTIENTWGCTAADGEWLGDFPTQQAAKQAVKEYNYANMRCA